MRNTDISPFQRSLNSLAQLSFSFQISNKTNFFREEDFLLLEENSAAISFLKKFFAQSDFRKAQFPSLILKGESGSGKTHLLHIFAKEVKAEFLDKEKISGVNLVNFFAANQFYILDDINEIKDEELILGLINSAAECQAFLILSARSTPQFGLKDLTSRLKNIFAIEIKNPSCESLKQLLANGFARKQIKLSRQVIDFIAGKINRNYEAILAAVKLVELHSQEGGKSITLAEAKKIFR